MSKRKPGTYVISDELLTDAIHVLRDALECERKTNGYMFPSDQISHREGHEILDRLSGLQRGAK